MSPKYDERRKPRRSRAVEAARPHNARAEVIRDLPESATALAREVSPAIPGHTESLRGVLAVVNEARTTIHERTGSTFSLEGSQAASLDAVKAGAGEITKRSSTALRLVQRAIESQVKSVGGDPARPLTLLPIVVDYGARDEKGSPLAGSLDANLQGADVLRRIDATARGLQEIEDPAELARVLQDAAATGDSLTAYAVEALPSWQRDALLRRATPQLASWPEQREIFRRSRNPKGFARLDALRDLGRALLDHSAEAIGELARVSGVHPKILGGEFEAATLDLRRLLGDSNS